MTGDRPDARASSLLRLSGRGLGRRGILLRHDDLLGVGRESNARRLQGKRVQDERFVLQDEKLALKDEKFVLQDEKFVLQDEKLALQDEKFVLQDEKFVLQDEKFVLHDDGFGLEGEGFAHEGVGFVLQDEGFVPRAKRLGRAPLRAYRVSGRRRTRRRAG